MSKPMKRTMTDEQKQKMREGRERARRAGPKKREKIVLPPAFRALQAIRKKCLDCCSTPTEVRWCTMDGVNSTRCELWPYRFGMRPKGAALKYGQRFLIPREMPPPPTPSEAAVALGMKQSGEQEP